MVLMYTLLVLATLFLLFFFRRHKNYLPQTNAEKRTSFELLMNLHRLRDWSAEVLEETRCTCVLKGPSLSNINLLATIDPANIHYILSKDTANFHKGPKFKQIFDVLGDGIINADYDTWKFQRKIGHTFFHQPRFNRLFDNILRRKTEGGLIPILEHACKQESVLDLQDILQRFTFDTACMLLTGQDPGSLSLDFPFIPFTKAADDAEEAMIHRHIIPERIWKLQRWLGIGMEKKLKCAWEALDEFTYQIIQKKRDELSTKEVSSDNSKGDEEEGVDLLTLYMAECKDTHGFESTEKFLRDMILGIAMAGRDSTGVALSWFFWLLTKHPQVEAKIREELQGISGKANGDENRLDLEDIGKLVYLNGAVSETLRLYPPVPFQHKSPAKHNVLPSGHEVDPSMEIIFDLFSMGRMRSIWGEDCCEFKPNRWISDTGNAKHEPSYKFVAFSAGPRTCLGKDMALRQMKATASSIINKYRFQVVEGHPVVPDVSVILHLKYGLKVKVLKQSN